MMITFRDIFSDLEIFFIFVHFIMKSKGMVQTFVSKTFAGYHPVFCQHTDKDHDHVLDLD